MRIAGITIEEKRQAQYGLTALYGVGLSQAQTICKACGVDPVKSVKDLTEDEQNKIRKYVEENLTIEGDLRREKSQNVKRLKDIQSHRGMRHARNLPVRGQRTKTNSRTVRGNKRVTMASGRTKVSKT